MKSVVLSKFCGRGRVRLCRAAVSISKVETVGVDPIEGIFVEVGRHSEQLREGFDAPPMHAKHPVCAQRAMGDEGLVEVLVMEEAIRSHPEMVEVKTWHDRVSEIPAMMVVMQLTFSVVTEVFVHDDEDVTDGLLLDV